MKYSRLLFEMNIVVRKSVFLSVQLMHSRMPKDVDLVLFSPEQWPGKSFQLRGRDVCSRCRWEGRFSARVTNGTERLALLSPWLRGRVIPHVYTLASEDKCFLFRFCCRG